MKKKLKAIEYWRSPLFPNDLAYCRVLSNHPVPSQYSIVRMARLLLDLRERYGRPIRVERYAGEDGKLITRWEWQTRKRLYTKKFKGSWTFKVR